MRRQVTVGGVVVLALLTGSMVAFAQEPAPAECAAAAVESAQRGLVPDARAQDEPGDDAPDEDADDSADDPDGDAADEPAADAADAEPAAEEPAESDATPAPDGECATSAETTAASALGWGAPAREDGFGDGVRSRRGGFPLDPAWEVYTGTGFDGRGTRTPDALTTENGVLTITGSPEGATGGMAWGPGQTYGRWEARVRTPASDPSYNALLLLWPDDASGTGSEIDFMEMLDPGRRTATAFLHTGAERAAATGEVAVDGTAWHNWAVEWTPTSITAYLDGAEWWTVDDPALLPTGPMHLCVQLDWFPTGEASVQESSMQVDWVRQYPAPGAPAPAATPPGTPTSGAAGDLATGEDAAGAASAGAAPPADGSGSATEGVRGPRLTEGAPDAPARPGLVPAARPAERN